MKFPTLIAIRRSLDKVSDGGLLNVVNHLIKNNHSSTIVSGIFRQLYFEGDSNSQEFLDELLTLCQNIEKQDKEDDVKQMAIDKGIDKSKPKINDIPDSLMNHITSYLNMKDIFNGWVHINRRCSEIGIYNNIELIEWDTQWIHKLNKHPPKFSMKQLLFKMKDLTWHGDDQTDMESFLNLANLKRIKTIMIGMYLSFFLFFCVLCQDCVFICN